MLVCLDGFFVKGVVNEPMKAPQALLSRIAEMPAMSTGSRRLIVVMGQLGDFDSVEYAQALVPRLEDLRDRFLSKYQLWQRNETIKIKIKKNEKINRKGK